MAQLLVRDIDEDIVRRLKERAKRHNRSLQSEARMILSQAAGFGFKEARDVASSWQKRFSGRKFPATVQMIREDRQR